MCDTEKHSGNWQSSDVSGIRQTRRQWIFFGSLNLSRAEAYWTSFWPFYVYAVQLQIKIKSYEGCQKHPIIVKYTSINSERKVGEIQFDLYSCEKNID